MLSSLRISTYFVRAWLLVAAALVATAPAQTVILLTPPLHSIPTCRYTSTK